MARVPSSLRPSGEGTASDVEACLLDTQKNGSTISAYKKRIFFPSTGQPFFPYTLFSFFCHTYRPCSGLCRTCSSKEWFVLEPKVARFQSFFTPVCLRFPRRTGVCLILDPKALNAFVRVQKLQSILFAVAFLHKEEFLVSIDIKDACAIPAARDTSVLRLVKHTISLLCSPLV